MRYKALFILLFTLLSGEVLANWKKINDLDYTWGPFKIYNISLFTETGEYQPNTRPLMLSLKYDKPVDGRDFAISIARSWARLNINLPEKNSVIDRLRKLLPDLKSGDTLHYIALEDRGYFVVNDQVISEEFNKATNNAILAIWLDPKVELSHKLIAKKTTGTQNIHIVEYDPENADEVNIISPLTEKKASSKELSDSTASTAQAVDFEQENETEKIQLHKQPVVGMPSKGIAEPQTKKAKETQIAEKIIQTVKDETKAISTSPSEIEKVTPKPDEQNHERKEDPENPEQDIRPIEDPLPKNIRTS